MSRTYFRPGQTFDPRLLGHFHDAMVEALRQLRLAVGSGTIFFGFDVRVERGLVHVGPGLAFDGAGQPLVLQSALPLPVPESEGPLWLALRHHPLVEEQDHLGRPLRESDSVEVVWLAGPPMDDETVPLARLLRGPGGWLADRSVARRAPPAEHRHSGESLPDRSGRLRYDGTPVRLAAPGAEPGGGGAALARLEGATAAEIAKLNSRLDQLLETQRTLALEVEELRSEVAETAERATTAGVAGWQEGLRALREEFSLTVGEELRAEMDELRAAHIALASRPSGSGPDLGAYTPLGTLHGVGESFARRLAEAGIETVSDLLAASARPEARERVEATGIGSARLGRWHREADLLRLHGVGPSEVALLGEAAIASSAALALAEPRALYVRLSEAATERGVTPPPLAWVSAWIEQARQLPPIVPWGSPDDD